MQLRELDALLSGDANGLETHKRGNIYKHIADSLCCTAETNTTSQSNYTPIKTKKNVTKLRKVEGKGNYNSLEATCM